MSNKKKYLHIRIDDGVKTRVYAVAHRHGMKPSEYVRAVIDAAYPPRPRDKHLARDQIAECITRNFAIANQPVDNGVVKSIAANLAMAIDEYGY